MVCVCGHVPVRVLCVFVLQENDGKPTFSLYKGTTVSICKFLVYQNSNFDSFTAYNCIFQIISEFLISKDKPVSHFKRRQPNMLLMQVNPFKHLSSLFMQLVACFR